MLYGGNWMVDCKYKLRYLPLFYEDMSEKISYISDTLRNPQAAKELLSQAENAILERLPVAEAFEQYHSMKDRDNPYYRIYVKNYVIYYVVLKDSQGNKIMEIRRFLYKMQNIRKFI